jgi:hypothetical protein
MNRRRKSPTLNITGNRECKRNRRYQSFRGTNINVDVPTAVTEENYL